MTTVVVGAGIAGLTTVEALRAEGSRERIVLIGNESRDPYSRPALSKQVLAGAWTAVQTLLRSPAELYALEVERLHGSADSVDLERRQVRIGRDRLAFDQLVIATGVRARRLDPGLGPSFVIRTLDDVLALQDVLAEPRRIAIVGAGVLGCELASALQASGHNVALLGRGPTLTFGDIGDALSARIRGLLVAGGVRVLLDARICSRDEHGVVLDDGRVIATDVLVAAIGSEPETAWLRDSGLDLTNGVVCDSHGLAAPDVWAVGDVAAWRDAAGVARRVEHQQMAIEQAQAVARSILDAAVTPPIEPFYWSRLCGTHILVHGRIPAGAQLERITGDDNREVLAARWNGRTEALVGWNAPREFRLARAELLRATLAPERNT